jgi:hypothetical protein
MINRELATKIYEYLNKKGAGLGNASILLIEIALDAELKDKGLRIYEYGHEGGVAIVQAPNIEQAREFIKSKLTENDIEVDDIPDNKIIDITPKEPGVIAYFDM